MVKKRAKIIWNDDAKYALKNIYEYIRKRESVAVAKKVRNEIVKSAKDLNAFPEKFVEDPFLKDEPGNYRFKVIWSYKIIYEITTDAILVLDIFHTSRDPGGITTHK
jgi:plasmid stabilization system protein ParE